MSNINLDWLTRLVEEREQESLILDFKRELPTKDDKGRNGFLSDMAAFANAQGGRLVYGIAEDGNGGADCFVPLSGSEEEAQLRLQEIVNSGIEPRLDGCLIQVVRIENGFLLAVDIPEQFGGPFEAHSGKWRRFPIRQGTTTAEMSYRQLRDAFGRREQLAVSMQDWRARRLRLLAMWIQQIRLTSGPWAVFHLMPVASFANSKRIDLHHVRDDGYRFRGYSGIARFNLDGVRFTLNLSDPVNEYAQFFRNGAIELAWECSTTKQGDLAVGSAKVLRNLLSGLVESTRIFAASEIDGGVSVALSLLNIAGRKLHFHSDFGEASFSTVFQDSEAVLEDEFVEHVTGLVEGAEPIAKSLSDKLFQAFGEDRSCYFGSQGKLLERFRKEWLIS